MFPPEWIEEVKAIAKIAGEIVADIYNHGKELSIKLKEDSSPFTTADLASDRYIRQALSQLAPNVPIISEEMDSLATLPLPADTYFWLVDPLDGTKEFIQRTGEFTVNIALIAQHQPVLGVVDVPLAQARYWAEQGKGSYFQEGIKSPARICVNTAPSDVLTIAISRSHCFESAYTDFIQKTQQWGKQVHLLKVGSALKICLVARGLADLYPRFGPTSAWDTAAGHIILNEAQGLLLDLKGKALEYGQKMTPENPPFIATTPCYLSQVLASLNQGF